MEKQKTSHGGAEKAFEPEETEGCKPWLATSGQQLVIVDIRSESLGYYIGEGWPTVRPLPLQRWPGVCFARP